MLAEFGGLFAIPVDPGGDIVPAGGVDQDGAGPTLLIDLLQPPLFSLV